MLACCAAPALAEDWPYWRGPQHNGTSRDTSFVAGWLENGLETRWRRPTGAGYASLSVAGAIAYTMDADGADEHIVALAVDDGRELWRVRSGRSPRDVYGGLGPRVTPTVAGGWLYTVSGERVLMALEASSGRLRWQQDLKELGARGPAEGYASSPLVDGERLLVMVGAPQGKALAAFERLTGKLLWTSQDDVASYSSPVPWTFEGVEQTLFLTAAVLYAVSPATGKLLWRYDWRTYDGVNVATPLVVPPDAVFISAGYDQGAALLRVQRDGDKLRSEEVWRNRAMKNHFNSSVHHDGAIFGFDESIFKCIDAGTGEERWKTRGFGKGSLILAADHLIVLSDGGELALVAADPQSFAEKVRLPVLRGRSWTPPTLAAGRLYLRNASEIVCLEPKTHARQ